MAATRDMEGQVRSPESPDLTAVGGSLVEMRTLSTPVDPLERARLGVFLSEDV